MRTDINKYLKRSPCEHLYPLEYADDIPLSSDNIRLAIVIPAYAESESLAATLNSLRASFAAAEAALRRNSLVVVVVNNPPPTAGDAVDLENSAKLADNQKFLQALRNPRLPGQSSSGRVPESGFQLAWIDAASSGKEISPKLGVGMARRLGMDAVLPLMDWSADPVICSLDADTLVDENYVAEIAAYFKSHPETPGAAVAYRHQKGDSPERERAIRKYEEYLDSYVEGLRSAGSPYAYYFIGSAMVFRVAAYVKAGGMPAKPAGEDFYFMQALRKTIPKLGERIGLIEGTSVHPSPRFSDRVVFGTGRRVETLMNAGKGAADERTPGCVSYHLDDFEALGEVLATAGAVLVHQGVDAFLNALSSSSTEFFEARGFRAVWPRIAANTPKSPERLEWAFHTWFDALKTFQFVRSRAEHPCPPIFVSRES